MSLKMGKGWRGESHRHSLARKGVKTSRKNSKNYFIINATLKKDGRIERTGTITDSKTGVKHKQAFLEVDGGSITEVVVDKKGNKQYKKIKPLGKGYLGGHPV